jgi:hypothetical protein
LFGGRINPEPVDLSFRHSISRPLLVDVFGDRLMGYGACGRGEITLLGHIADNHIAARADHPKIREAESQRRYASFRAVPNSSNRWKWRAFFGFFVNQQCSRCLWRADESVFPMIAATWHVVYIPGAFNSIRSFRRGDYVNAYLAIQFIRSYVVSIRISVWFGDI